MNNIDWHNETNISRLWPVVCQGSRRKLMMFGLACLREYPLGNRFDDWQSAMAACEAMVDGVTPIPKWERIRRNWSPPRHIYELSFAVEAMLMRGFLDYPPTLTDIDLGRLLSQVSEGLGHLEEALVLVETQGLDVKVVEPTQLAEVAAVRDRIRKRVQKRQADLLRDVYGFGELPFDPAWRTETAVGVATSIYDDRAFDRMPILADALQDAGCEDEAILGHCRGDGPHVRGCWVVDLVLGKE